MMEKNKYPENHLSEGKNPLVPSIPPQPNSNKKFDVLQITYFFLPNSQTNEADAFNSFSSEKSEFLLNCILNNVLQ